MNGKLIPFLITSCFLISCTNNNSDSSTDYSGKGQTVSVVEKDTTAFTNSDYTDVTSESGTTITFNGDSITSTDTTKTSIEGNVVTINKKGNYFLTGSGNGAQVIVNETSKSGDIFLVLNDVEITNSSAACLLIKSAEKVILQTNKDSTNSFISNYSSSYTDDSRTIDGAIYSTDTITINGSGTLNVNSKVHGIVCKDDLKILGDLTLNIESSDKGIDANDSVRIGNGTINITSGKDGIHLENSLLDSYFYMEDGDLTITSACDAIDVGTDTEYDDFYGYVKLVSGTLNLTSGGGSNKSKSSSYSSKGIKSDGDCYFGNINLNINSNDDAIHTSSSISITDGVVELSTSDDAIHADGTVSISGGELTIDKAYEGIEAYIVKISGGKTILNNISDDGINAAGGNDSDSSESNPWSNSTTTGTIYISGGYVYVNSSGDGIDSNGSIYVTGGTTIVEGPINNGNGALDKGDGTGCVASITGGTVLAIGSVGMAINFDSGMQCSALVLLSGSSGSLITVNDGSNFNFTASKKFSCAVYSSSGMKMGNSYTISADSTTMTMDFSSSYYYSNVTNNNPGRW